MDTVRKISVCVVTAALFTVTGFAFADPPAGPDQTRTADAGTKSADQPVRHTAARRIEAFGISLRSAGLPVPVLPPPAAQYSVTPSAPNNSGALIATAGPGYFQNSGASGSFILQPPRTASPPGYAPASVGLSFPSEVGKVYVLDCMAANPNVAALQIGFAKLANPTPPHQHVTVDAGHALYSVRATTPSTSVNVETVGDRGFSFFGCEITKLP